MVKKFNETLQDGLADPDMAFALRLAEFLYDDDSDNVTRTMILLYHLNAIALTESEGDRRPPEEYLELIISKMREIFPSCKNDILRNTRHHDSFDQVDSCYVATRRRARDLIRGRYHGTAVTR